MTLSNLLCPACGHAATHDALELVERHHDRIAGKDYELLRCAACRLVFTEPRDPVGPEWYARAFAQGIIERSRIEMFGWRIEQFRSHGLHGSLFDIGCGDGVFLTAAQELGFKASGFDFDPDAVAKARSLGLDARASDFDSTFGDAGLQAAFDVVTLFDVLEHVPEPAGFLARAMRLVKPGGHMVFTMPDDRRPHPWDREELDYPPNHYTRWRPETLRRLLESQGLIVLRITSTPIDARYLAGQAFFNFLMPRCLPWIKRRVFGDAKSVPGSGGKIDAAAPAGRLADKGLRARLVDAAFKVFNLLLLPVTWPMSLGYRLAGYGHTLYALARVPDRK